MKDLIQSFMPKACALTILLIACAAASVATATVHTLTVNMAGLGTISSSYGGIGCGKGGNICSASFDPNDPQHGSMVTLTASPWWWEANGHNVFVGWTGDCSGTGDCQLDMNSDHTVTAHVVSVKLTQPLNNSSRQDPSSIVLKAIASEATDTFTSGIAIGKVEFYDGTPSSDKSNLIGSSSSTDADGNYTITWNNSTRTISAGNHLLFVKAYDSSGLPAAQSYGVTLSVTQHTGTDPVSGLIGNWTFDSVDTNWGYDPPFVNDIVGGYNGYMNYMIPGDSVPGRINQALHFNGKQLAFGNIGDAAQDYRFIQNSGVFTISTWIKLRDYAQQKDESISSDSYTGNQQGFYFLYDNSQNQGKLAFETLSYATDPKGAYRTLCNLVIPNAISDDVWHMVTVTGDGSNCKMYLDGQSKASDTIKGFSVGGSAGEGGQVGVGYGHGLMIGSSYGGHPLDGAMDDFRIYSTTLSAADVLNLYAWGQGGSIDSTLPSTPSGLVIEGVFATHVDLSWNASTDNVAVAGYRIYRNGSQIALVQGTSFQDVNVALNTSYTYRVEAYDAAGNKSEGQSNQGAATTPATRVAQASGDIYIANSIQANDTGANCANAHSADWFNNPNNWSKTINSTDGTVSPGATVHLCGIVSTPLTFQGSGTYNGVVPKSAFETQFGTINGDTYYAWMIAQGYLSSSGQINVPLDILLSSLQAYFTAGGVTDNVKVAAVLFILEPPDNVNPNLIHRITLKFEPWAKMSAPVWNSSKGAVIDTAIHSYITIDGQGTGVIEATDNGTTLDYQHSLAGIIADGSNDITIQNLTITGMYYRTPLSTTDTNRLGTGISVGSSNNIVIRNNSVTEGDTMIGFNLPAGYYKNFTLDNNFIGRCNHAITLEFNVDNTWGSNLIISNNRVELGGVWHGVPGNHNDGVIMSNDAPHVDTVHIDNVQFFNNYFTALFGTSAMYIPMGNPPDMTNVFIFNNIYAPDPNGAQQWWANGAVSLGGTQSALIANNTFISQGSQIPLGASAKDIGIYNNMFINIGMGMILDTSYSFIQDYNDLKYYHVDNNLYDFYMDPTFSVKAFSMGIGFLPNNGAGIKQTNFLSDPPSWMSNVDNGNVPYDSNSVIRCTSQNCPSFNLNAPILNSTSASGDYRPFLGDATYQPSPAIGKGKDLSSYCSVNAPGHIAGQPAIPQLCLDYNGNPRPAGSNWDVGAYQSGSTGNFTYNLNVSKLGQGSGMVTCNGGTCPNTISAGTQLTMVATPDANSSFAGWSGVCMGISSTCTTTVSAYPNNAIIPVVAIFNNTLLPHTVMVNASAGGSIGYTCNGSSCTNQVSVGTVTVGTGDQMTFTFTPNPGNTIYQIVDNGSLVDAPGNVYQLNNITSNHTITASFVQKGTVRYALNLIKSGIASDSVTATSCTDYPGSVCPSLQQIDYGTKVTLTASKGPYSNFSGWSIVPAVAAGADCTATSQTCTVTMNGDVTATAAFTVPTYTLSITQPTHGKIKCSFNSGASTDCADSTKINKSDTITLTAQADPNYNFNGWGGGTCLGVNNPCVISPPINANFSVSATMVQALPNVTIALSGASSFVAPANVGISITTSEVGGTISTVDIYSSDPNGNPKPSPIGTVALPANTATWNWTANSSGTYNLVAVATDATGQTATSNSVSVNVDSGNTTLVSHWTFDNNSNGITWASNTSKDSAGNYDGVVHNMTSADQSTGALNEALHFNGSTGATPSYIGPPGTATFTDYNFIQLTGRFSIGVWVKLGPSPSVPDETIISNQYGSDRPGATITYNYTSKSLYFEFGNNAPFAVCRVLRANAITDTATWHYVVATANGSQCQLYLDGAPLGVAQSFISTLATRDGCMDSTAGTMQTCSNHFLNIGASYYPNLSPYKGYMDDVSIYNGALSATQIRSNYLSVVGNSQVYGDIDGVPGVTINDAAKIAQSSVGLIVLTPLQAEAADVNNDTKVNILDALSVAQYAVGLTSNCPKCETPI